MKQNKDTVTPKELLHELQALIADGEAMIADSVTEHSTEAIESMRARFASARERIAETYEGARKKVIAGAEYTDATIRANPYQAIAIAAGVGLIIGLLVGRRGNK